MTPTIDAQSQHVNKQHQATRTGVAPGVQGQDGPAAACIHAGAGETATITFAGFRFPQPQNPILGKTS